MESNKLFSTLNRADLADRIIFEIKKMISERRLLPGQKLPTERELTEQFGVSRASVREALHSLETLGLVDARVGSGTYVVENPDAILKHLSWAVYFSESMESDLTEARKIIEPEIAAMAAQNATDAEIAELSKRLTDMERAAHDPEEAAQQDYNFHIALARAAHNRVLEEMMVSMQWILRGTIARRLQRDRSMEYVCLAEHQRIYESVKRRDCEAARREMRLSVDERKLFQQKQTDENDQEDQQ